MKIGVISDTHHKLIDVEDKILDLKLYCYTDGNGVEKISARVYSL